MRERAGPVIAVLLALLTACATAPARAPDRVVLGLVPTADVDRIALAAEGLGRLLAERLGTPVETRVVDGDEALVGALRAGQVDVGLLGPPAGARAVDEADAVVVLQSVRGGTPTTHVQWMTGDPARFCTTPVVATERDGPTFCNGTDTARVGPVGEQALARLVEGEPVVYVQEGSLAGHLYPSAQLRRVAGLDPITGVDTRFVDADRDAVLAVARGDAPVGVAAVDARDELLEDEPDIGTAVTVFAWSTEIPHDVVAVRVALPVDLRERIADAMTAVIATPRGSAAFDAVYGIEGLVPAGPDVLDVARKVVEDFSR